jgi:ribose 5-phosphate isomerase B
MSDLHLAHPGDVIAIASDHAGVELKETLKSELTALGYKPLDLGTNSSDSVDYPDYGHALAKSILDKKAKAGVAICGSGIGISIAANRHAGIRAALAHDENTAKLSREHNDANILALGARIVSPDTAKAMLKTFFATDFAGGRHAGRVTKLG